MSTKRISTAAALTSGLRVVTALTLGVIATGIGARSLSAQSSTAGSAVPIPPVLKVFDPSFIDTTAHACRDFFAFANGAWLKRDTIPPAFSTSGVGKDMTDANELVVRSVLDEAMASRRTEPANSTRAKLGTFYATCMDSTLAEQQGVSPIRAQLDSISAIATRTELVRQIGELQKAGVGALFEFGPGADPKDADHYIAWVSQGGLGMPDRDY
jgi:putative endopeptidase